MVLCSGKVYYDLLERRSEQDITDVALLRMEQITPFPSRSLTVELSKYSQAEIVWCQEEPQNQGAWGYAAPRIDSVLEGLSDTVRRLRYIGRPEAASPASGSFQIHLNEQRLLVDEALAAPNVDGGFKGVQP